MIMVWQTMIWLVGWGGGWKKKVMGLGNRQEALTGWRQDTMVIGRMFSLHYFL